MVVKGYGLGGYGTEEPWGSVEYLINDLQRNASNTAFMGILEATANIIGEADNEIGGLYSTKLSSVGNIGDTSILVQSTLNWDTLGKVSIDGIVYYYTNITSTTINGLYYINEGIIAFGLAKLHKEDSEVINLNSNLNALQLVRNCLLIDYAEGPYLDAIGRKYGLPRKPLYGDDSLYRELIKAIVFSPRGTVYGIELALNALLGYGNYEIYEDLIRHHNEVFIKVADDYFLNDNPYGETYLSESLFGITSGSSNTIVLPYEPLKVSSVKLKDLGETFDFRNDIPSAVSYEYFEGNGLDSAFTYSGSISEANIIENGYYTNFNLGSSGTLYYDMLASQGARIINSSDVELNFVIRIPSSAVLGSGLLKQTSFAIYDGSKVINFGIDSDYKVGFFNTELGGFISNTYTLSTNTFYNIRIIKYGTKALELYINGGLVDRILYGLFSVNSFLHKLSFGMLGTPLVGNSFDIKQLGINIKNYKDYWSSQYNNIGYVNTLSPTQFNITGTYSFVNDDIGKCFEVLTSSVVNPYGGNNNVKGRIKNVLSTLSILLEPIQYDKGIIGIDGNNNVFKLGDITQKFVYPDDLGKNIEIMNSNLGNNGTYTIIDLLVEGVLETDGIIKSLGSYNGKNKEYTNTAILSSTLTPEEDLQYIILVSFITEANMDFVQSESGDMSGNTLTLRSPLWSNNLVMEIGISNVLSAQLLQDENVHNSIISTSPLLYQYYPFYLSDVFGDLEGFLEDLTIAGVIPRLLGK